MGRLNPIAWATAVALSIPAAHGICQPAQSRTAQTEQSRSAHPAQSRAATPERQEFDAQRMRHLAGWAARLSGRTLPEDYAVPVAIRLAPEVIGQMVCPDDPSHCRQIAAAYNIERREVIYRHDLDPRRLLDQSYLVHELVHSLQHHDIGVKINISCQMILDQEQEAYTAQALFLRLHGNDHPVGLELARRTCPAGSEVAG